MNIERGPTGVSWRWTNPKKILTVFGTETVNKCTCRSCKQAKNENEFYHFGNRDPMTICIECDDKRRKLDAKIKRRKDKGIYVDKNLEPLSNLEEFLC